MPINDFMIYFFLICQEQNENSGEVSDGILVEIPEQIAGRT